MMRFDVRAARVAWTVFLVGLLLFVAYQSRQALLIFVLALFFSYMIYPLVALVEKRKPPRVSRTASISLVFVMILSVLGGLIATVGPIAVDQGIRFTQRIPEMIKNPPALFTRAWPEPLERIHPQVLEQIREQGTMSADRIVPIVQHASRQVLEVAGNLVFVVLVPILSFMFLKDGPEMRDTVLYWFGSGPQRALWEGIFDDLDFVLAKYMRAILLLSLATFTVYFSFFQFTGLPYAVVLASMAAVFEFVPLVGPLATAVIVTLVALLTGYTHVVGLIIFFIVYRLFQDYVLSPHLMSEGVELHPLLVIFGILAGDQIGGVWGMFFSIPVLATLRAVAMRLKKASQAP